MSDQPSWLQENPSSTAPVSKVQSPKTPPVSQPSPPPPAPVAQPSSSSSSSSSSNAAAEEVPYRRVVKMTIITVTIGLMVFMAYTGAMGIAGANGSEDSGVAFVSLYMIFFAAILVTYEIAQICPSKSFDDMIKRNFGFLYGPFGKSSFIIFMGILAFGLKSPRDLAIATGVLVTAWGFIIGLLFLKFPGYFDKKEKYSP